MPKSHRYATFPSVSLGWVFTSEKFMEEQSKWLFGKLRFSWGKLGNQEIENYPYTATYAASGNYYLIRVELLRLVLYRIQFQTKISSGRLHAA